MQFADTFTLKELQTYPISPKITISKATSFISKCQYRSLLIVVIIDYCGGSEQILQLLPPLCTRLDHLVPSGVLHSHLMREPPIHLAYSSTGVQP